LKEAIALVNKNDKSEFTILVISHRLPDCTADEFIISAKQHGLPCLAYIGTNITNPIPSLSYFFLLVLILIAVASRPALSKDERSKCILAGAFECFTLATLTQDALLSHMKAICESGWIKKQLKTLLLKEKEDFILDYDTDAHLYNKERVTRYRNFEW
jgi:hypothetical protein